jgi:sulfite reductase (NADPH) hemoprotein beta-component
LKRNLKPLIQRINQAMIDSIGGCGDVNRNVLCNPNPERSTLHGEVYGWARRICEHLLPKTRAYHEIWLDGEPVAGGESEPIYGKTYLPRKFKTAVAEAVVSVQRDFGDRISRRHARLKYTIERMGLAAFVSEVEQRAGVHFEPPRKVQFTSQGDRYGWVEDGEGRWHLTLYIENGRVVDTPGAKLMSGLRAIAEIHQGDFRITPSQNLIVAGVATEQKATIEGIARRQGLLAESRSPTRLASIACVVLPTCPQAMAEAERYFPGLLQAIEEMAQRHGIEQQAIVMRMTGCPNGCARPYVAEIGLVGKGPGRYNRQLGGDGSGLRLNGLYRKNLDETELLQTLDELFRRYASERLPREGFGDFVIRRGVVKPVINPAEDYHGAA